MTCQKGRDMSDFVGVYTNNFETNDTRNTTSTHVPFCFFDANLQDHMVLYIQLNMGMNHLSHPII